MLCNLLKQIYLDNIHKLLSRNEFIYSAEVKQTFLDLWNSVTNIKTYSSYPKSVFYLKNDKHLFEVAEDDIFFYHERKISNIFKNEYSMDYDEVREFIRIIIKDISKIDIQYCDSLSNFYWDSLDSSLL